MEGTGKEQYAIIFTLQKLFNQSQHYQSTVIPLYILYYEGTCIV